MTTADSGRTRSLEDRSQGGGAFGFQDFGGVLPGQRD